MPQLTALIATMDMVLIVDNFVARYGGAITSLSRGEKLPNLTTSDIADFTGAVTLIANDSAGKAIISSAVYHEKGKEKRLEFKFSSKEARDAQRAIEQQTFDLQTPVFETKANVLMVFWQSNIDDPPAGKKTRERVVIESIHPKPLAITYETDEVRERIKYETREDERNVYKKGFFVDWQVERLRRRPVAYRITAVRDVIDLPDDESRGRTPRLV